MAALRTRESGEIEVEVRVVLRYPIPADIAERERLYGTSDLVQCVQIDLDNDPVEFVLDSTLVSVELADIGEQGHLDASSRTEVMARFLCEHDHAGDTEWHYGADQTSTRRRSFYRALARDVLEKVAEMGAHFGSSEAGS